MVSNHDLAPLWLNFREEVTPTQTRPTRTFWSISFSHWKLINWLFDKPLGSVGTWLAWVRLNSRYQQNDFLSKLPPLDEIDPNPRSWRALEKCHIVFPWEPKCSSETHPQRTEPSRLTYLDCPQVPPFKSGWEGLSLRPGVTGFVGAVGRSRALKERLLLCREGTRETSLREEAGCVGRSFRVGWLTWQNEGTWQWEAGGRIERNWREPCNGAGKPGSQVGRWQENAGPVCSWARDNVLKARSRGDGFGVEMLLGPPGRQLIDPASKAQNWHLPDGSPLPSDTLRLSDNLGQVVYQCDLVQWGQGTHFFYNS